MPFLPPNQQRQSTEGTNYYRHYQYNIDDAFNNSSDEKCVKIHQEMLQSLTTYIVSNRYYWKKTITSKFMKNNQKMLQSLTIYTVSNHYYWKKQLLANL